MNRILIFGYSKCILTSKSVRRCSYRTCVLWNSSNIPGVKGVSDLAIGVVVSGSDKSAGVVVSPLLGITVFWVFGEVSGLIESRVCGVVVIVSPLLGITVFWVCGVVVSGLIESWDCGVVVSPLLGITVFWVCGLVVSGLIESWVCGVVESPLLGLIEFWVCGVVVSS